MPPAATDASSAREVFRSRPVLAALLVAACALVPEVAPGLARFRLFGRRPTREAAVTPAGVVPAASIGESKLGLETTAPRAAPGSVNLVPAGAEEAKALEQAPPVPL